MKCDVKGRKSNQNYYDSGETAEVKRRSVGDKEIELTGKAHHCCRGDDYLQITPRAKHHPTTRQREGEMGRKEGKTYREIIMSPRVAGWLVGGDQSEERREEGVLLFKRSGREEGDGQVR